MKYFICNGSCKLICKVRFTKQKFAESTITDMQYNPSALIFTLVEYSTLIKQKENIPTIVEVMNQVPRLVPQALDHLLS